MDSIVKLGALIHKEVFIELHGLKIKVRILDVKENWGKIRYKVTPVAGSGETWIEYFDQKEI